MNSTRFRQLALVATLLGFSGAIAACGASVKGTYSDASGAFVLDLKSGGAASFTFMGATALCSYQVNGNSLALDCKGELGKVALTIHDDGSLTGPSGTLMPALRKAKS